MGERHSLQNPVMDGGGIRGIFPAAVLAYLEQEHLEGKSIGDHFDLIAGTSTGGILGDSWILPPPHSLDRRPLSALGPVA